MDMSQQGDRFARNETFFVIKASRDKGRRDTGEMKEPVDKSTARLQST
jgi:hypothetical protein